ncbi:uncharacterized protein LOC106136540 [Amyelois transitella]|uniref:uncharacterized protein LOC106136540 n=1 Tax=Amyelois transitella TaxID=680683 RepID=UPI00298FA32B|nr:uncharacterized protein LOC106136540 [Amyelois transitella]
MNFFTINGEDLSGIQRPQDINYMKQLRIYMIIIGAWPGKLFGEPERYRLVYRCYNFALSFSLFVSDLLYIRNNTGVLTFIEIGHSYITALMNVVCLARYASVFSKKLDKSIVDFVREIHLFNHRNESEYSYKNWYVSFSCALLFIIYDLVIALLVFHLWGHLKILTHNLERFPKPGFKGSNGSTLQYSDEESLEVTERLKMIVNHHSFILGHSNNISDVFGLNIAIYYMYFQISGCLLLLECSQLDTTSLINFGPLTLSLVQLLAQVSIIFEFLSSMTDHVMRGAYDVPWECMDVKNRKMVLMLLRQAQIPLGLKALGVVEVGVRTMATILKTSLSYFMMLKTFAADE